MGTGFIAGLRHVGRGFRLIAQPGVRRYVAIPLVINVAVFVAALWSIGLALDELLTRYIAHWPEWLHWLVWLLCAAIAALFVFFSFSLVANIVASPFNGLLADAVEAMIRGDRAMRIVQQRGVRYDELRVADVMTPLAMLEAVDLDAMWRFRTVLPSWGRCCPEALRTPDVRE